MDEDEVLSDRLSIAISKEALERIDDWRRQQPMIPPRARAVRMLLELGMAAATEDDQPPRPRAKRRSTRGKL
jgi:hypothetical protein